MEVAKKYIVWIIIKEDSQIYPKYKRYSEFKMNSTFNRMAYSIPDITTEQICQVIDMFL